MSDIPTTKQPLPPIGQFVLEDHFPTDEEVAIMKYVEKRRFEMDTEYRRILIRTAQWARQEYDSIPQERLDNIDLFKTGLSRAVVDHRLVMHYDNPSETIYKSVEDSDGRRVEILRQLDKWDKSTSKYEATMQQLERDADIEGTAIGQVKWFEQFDGAITVGKYCTLTETIDIEDFFWDEAGIHLNGYAAFTCNDAIRQKTISLGTFRTEFSGTQYKNIKSVRPATNFPNLRYVWNDGWKDGDSRTWKSGIWNSTGAFVTVSIHKIKRFWNNELNKFEDKEFIVANGQLVYEGEMQEPWVNGQKWLPYFKLVGIATGNFGGLGIPVLIRHPQEALDRMLTMTVAQAELAVNPVLFYAATGELLPDTIDYYPGAAYPYKGTGNGLQNDLQFFQQPDITNGAQYTIEKMTQIITMITGVDIQALVDTSSELAIQTQNKAEIQEKILKMTTLWNERHGLYDMAVIRLAYIQKYYPQRRVERIIRPNGVATTRTGYPEIGIDDFKVQSAFENGKNVTKLVEQRGAYSKLSVRPEDVQIFFDVSIESSHADSGANTIKQNKWDKMLDSLARIPGIDQVLDPPLLVKNTIKIAGFKQSEVVRRDIQDTDDDQHPARKEFKAILISDTLPFDPITPDDYMPLEYLAVFKEMMKLPEFRESSATVQKLASERLALHIMDFSDPYFEERQKKGDTLEATAKVESDRQSGKSLKPLGGSDEPPTSLSSRVRSRAAEIGAR